MLAPHRASSSATRAPSPLMGLRAHILAGWRSASWNMVVLVEKMSGNENGFFFPVHPSRFTTILMYDVLSTRELTCLSDACVRHTGHRRGHKCGDGRHGRVYHRCERHGVLDISRTISRGSSGVAVIFACCKKSSSCYSWQKERKRN